MAQLAFTVAILSVSLGFGWMAVLLQIPVPPEMEALGWQAILFPLIPGLMLVFVGVQFFLQHSKVPANKLGILTGLLAVYILAVVVSIVFVLKSDLPWLHSAFNWAFYLLPLTIVLYKVEKLYWTRPPE